MRIIDGIDVDTLEEQFPAAVSGTLIMDADGMLYECTNKVANLSTAIRRAKTKIFEAMFLAKCTTVRAHLTSKNCWKAGRKKLIGIKPYQGNRDGKPKPPLLEPLREALSASDVFLPHEGVEVYLHRDVEADDAMMQDAYTISDAIVWSPDKDLRIVPCPWYDVNTGKIDTIRDRYGWIKWDNWKGKVVGHGTAFFWAQMLMGDSADNVKGILALNGVLCGPAATAKALVGLQTEDEAANVVLDGYRAIDQNPLPEAGMLWLLRTPLDTAEGYIWSLGLTEQNRAFVAECYNRVYRRDAESTYG